MKKVNFNKAYISKLEQSAWLVLLFAIFLFYYLIMKKRKSSIKKLKHKKKRRSSAELHKVLPTLKLAEDKKPEKSKVVWYLALVAFFITIWVIGYFSR